MTPDPEREVEMQKRIAALLRDAPQPDAARLAMALSAARARQRRSKRRALMLLIGAALLGGGAGAAAWWVAGDPSPEPAIAPAEMSDPAPENQSREREDRAGTPEDRPGNTGNDRIIYQRAD